MRGDAALARRSVAYIVPGDPATTTGGFLYGRRMMAALGKAGMLDRVIALPDRFPRGDDEAIAIARREIAGLPMGTVLIVDGLAFTALAPTLRCRDDLRLVAVIHHPLCDETGLTDGERRIWHAAEQAALEGASHVIVSSQTTCRRLADFGVREARVSVVLPGIDPPIRGRPRRVLPPPATPLTLLTVANLIPRKGQDLLVKALIRVRDRRWRAILTGPARDQAFARRLRRLIETSGLRGRIALTGEVSARRLHRLFASADLFVLPSYHEGYGIALVEAVARGVPVLTTLAGAIPEAVPRGAGVFVRAGDAAHLADALARLLSGDRRPLAALRSRARMAAAHCRSWHTAGADFVTVINRLQEAP